MLNDRSPLAYGDVKVSRGDDKVKQNHRSDENTLCSCTVFIKHSILQMATVWGCSATQKAQNQRVANRCLTAPEEASPTSPMPAIPAQGSAGKGSR